LIILKPKTKKVARHPLVGSYFRLPFAEVVTMEAGRVMPYCANLAKQGTFPFHVFDLILIYFIAFS
jgi:hypothetical protein